MANLTKEQLKKKDLETRYDQASLVFETLHWNLILLLQDITDGIDYKVIELDVLTAFTLEDFGIGTNLNEVDKLEIIDGELYLNISIPSNFCNRNESYSIKWDKVQDNDKLILYLIKILLDYDSK